MSAYFGILAIMLLVLCCCDKARDVAQYEKDMLDIAALAERAARGEDSDYDNEEDDEEPK